MSFITADTRAKVPMPRTIAKRVAQGAAYLDRIRPDWFNEIKIQSLRLEDGEKCVLGQLAIKASPYYISADYLSAVKELDLCTGEEVALGFTLDEAPGIPDMTMREEIAYFKELTKEWKAAIRKRRDA